MGYPATFAGFQPAALWAEQNPVLEQFEIGLESDSGAVKVGDGIRAWNDLPHFTRNGVKTYRAALTQTGTDAPVATVRENTLGGEVVWTRSLAGSYVGTLAGAFPTAQTVVSPTGYSYVTSAALPADDNILVGIDFSPPDTLLVKTVSGVDSSGVDGYLSNWPIEVLVFP